MRPKRQPFPAWLQELRDIMGLATYEARQDALNRWERRWVVPVARDGWYAPDEALRARVQQQFREAAAMDLADACQWPIRMQSIPDVDLVLMHLMLWGLRSAPDHGDEITPGEIG